MIKMIIIDDEEWIIRLIRNLIPADELGIKIMGEASNGLDGLETLQARYHTDRYKDARP